MSVPLTAWKVGVVNMNPAPAGMLIVGLVPPRNHSRPFDAPGAYTTVPTDEVMATAKIRANAIELPRRSVRPVLMS